MLFDWPVLVNQLLEFADTADVWAHSLFVVVVSF